MKQIKSRIFFYVRKVWFSYVALRPISSHDGVHPILPISSKKTNSFDSLGSVAESGTQGTVAANCDELRRIRMN